MTGAEILARVREAIAPALNSWPESKQARAYHALDGCVLLTESEATAPRRFWAKVHPEPDSLGCWIWIGATMGNGYGVLRMGHSDSVPAHRWSYEHFVAPIPDGMEIDHLCRNPGCVNPAHMEPVTHQENGLRGTSKPAENARKTECPQGHPYDDENTYVDGRGRRYCRTCVRERQRRRYANDPAYKAKKDARRG